MPDEVITTRPCFSLTGIGTYRLNYLRTINVVLGKNGSGKSTLLRELERVLRSNATFSAVRYLSPERGGELVYDPGVEQGTNQSGWLRDQRDRNLTPNFRQQSVVQFRRLKELVLEEIEQNPQRRSDFDYKFDTYVAKLNELLDEIKLVRDRSTFKIFGYDDDTERSAAGLSSGENELISLGIECLIFAKETRDKDEGLLLLDEPDVHLHPDLQVRLVKFLRETMIEGNFRVIIATHSTALLGALNSQDDTGVCFLQRDDRALNFRSVSTTLKKLLPMFGAHPLSNLFNEAPPLILEGEDDERVWQYAIRASDGKIKVYPSSCDGLPNFSDFENEVIAILQSVYDSARAYSIRDRDDSAPTIDDAPPIIRMRLSCRTVENLILADETLRYLGTTWDHVCDGIDKWLDHYRPTGHPHFSTMERFKSEGFARKSFGLKDIRNDLMGIIGSNKSWELAVGRTIGTLQAVDLQSNDPNSVVAYLGEKIVASLLKK